MIESQKEKTNDDVWSPEVVVKMFLPIFHTHSQLAVGSATADCTSAHHVLVHAQSLT